MYDNSSIVKLREHVKIFFDLGPELQLPSKLM